MARPKRTIDRRRTKKNSMQPATSGGPAQEFAPSSLPVAKTAPKVEKEDESELSAFSSVDSGADEKGSKDDNFSHGQDGAVESLAENSGDQELEDKDEDEASRKNNAASSPLGRKRRSGLLVLQRNGGKSKQLKKSTASKKTKHSKREEEDEESYLESESPDEASSEEFKDSSEAKDEDFDEDDLDIKSSKKPTRRRRAPRSVTKRWTRVKEFRNRRTSEDATDGGGKSPGSPTRRHTPSRASAVKANARLLATMHEDGNNDDDDKEITEKRNRKKEPDEDEFVLQEDEEDEDEENEDYSEEGSSCVGQQVANVDDDEGFLTADSSDGDQNTDPPLTLNVKNSRQERHEEIDDDDDDEKEEASFSSSGDFAVPSSKSSSLRLPDCSSTEDAITMERLPKPHVCFFAPNQQSRQCFALETLHRIAMTSSLRGADGNRCFLQPPHFRSPMSDDMIDQIASRFGRAALQLQGEFYDRKHASSDGFTRGRDEENENDDFLEHFNRYVSDHMGSSDIYCCPVCYVESHRRLSKSISGDEESDGSDDSGEDSDQNSQHISLWQDPMVVLGFPDNEKYLLAASFCFRRVADVKRHLCDDHDIDPGNLDGNHLFQQYKVRAGDGLLQRFIDKSFKGHTFQGDMRRYWSTGCNQTFVYLIHLMQRHAAMKSKNDAGMPVPEDCRDLIENATKFFLSFTKRAKRSWNVISGPFTKASKEDLRDFIVEGDVEEDEEPHFVFDAHRHLSPEDEIVENLERKRRQKGHADSSEDSEQDVEDPVEEVYDRQLDYNSESNPGYYSEEEEEDEWVASRRPGKWKPSAKGAATTVTPKGAKRLRTGSSPVKKTLPSDQLPTGKEARKQTLGTRLVVLDSDSD